uniref:Uncharacterized protein n=1 Tax=Chromera velia CCMP2878 TaxID=1169474 RepID=A0A0G4HZQ0_9ALVE|eukprot:Cvel_9776.t1-p1 / transcript=Cvel_9776.t1 / gene=Cvel_9776 / organism=Chromera_velia_CCMP2878 / gene_product=hypothetical protein / transcript_product=hypothetical protein / location=Cvel_scaffold573:30599-33644(+) / protein_length=282 / sequence_SO=supercontig / SO=protein_coding / is_pseudo=false
MYCYGEYVENSARKSFSNSRIRFFEGVLEKPHRDGNGLGHSQNIRVASFEVVPVDPDRSLGGLQDRRVLSFCSFTAGLETKFLSAADAIDSFGNSTRLWNSEVLSFDPHIVTLMLEGPEALYVANSIELFKVLVMANSTKLSEALVMANSTELQGEPSLSGWLWRRLLSSWRRVRKVASRGGRVLSWPIRFIRRRLRGSQSDSLEGERHCQPDRVTSQHTHTQAEKGVGVGKGSTGLLQHGPELDRDKLCPPPPLGLSLSVSVSAVVEALTAVAKIESWGLD